MKNYKRICILVILLIMIVGVGARSVYANKEIHDETKYHVGEIVEIFEKVERDENNFFGNVSTEKTKVKILKGPLKGELIEAVATTQKYKDYENGYKVGDKVVIIENLQISEGKFFVADHYRMTWVYWLIGFFVLIILLIGRKAGIKSLASMSISIILVVVFIYLIVQGLPPIPTAIGLAVLNTIVTIIVVAGFSKKSLASILGTIIGIIIAFGLAYLIGFKTHITGLANEQAIYLQTIDSITINPQSLLYSGIIIGALGAIMDVAMSIASSIEEVYKADSQLTIRELYNAGMQVGRDVMGTMTNTLVLAYLSSSLPLFILIYINSSDLPFMYNMDYIVTEIVRIFTGSIGLIAAIPCTCAIAACLKYK
ncbi:MAG: YibE/F family protein [Eubacteriales bacterium]|nr:YibE/F family protein [Eubacteriales bacterium]MDY3333045.1 YibE/F family protein [Gallibacter sp.]